MALAPAGETLLSGCVSSRVFGWDAATGRVKFRLALKGASEGGTGGAGAGAKSGEGAVVAIALLRRLGNFLDRIVHLLGPRAPLDQRVVGEHRVFDVAVGAQVLLRMWMQRWAMS